MTRILNLTEYALVVAFLIAVWAYGGAPLTATATTPKVKTSAAMFDSRCADAYNGVRWYRAQTAKHRNSMNGTGLPPLEKAMNCKRLRERADYWRWAANANRIAAVIWKRREYADPPYPYLQIAICETGGINGGRPLWTHHNSSYAGAYGFAHSTWTQFRYPGYPYVASQATPRQQTRVAMRLVARFGGYSSWPACSVRLGLR